MAIAALAKFSSRMIVLADGGSLAFAGLTNHWLKENQSHRNIDLLEEESPSDNKNDADTKEPDSPRSTEEKNERLRRQMGDASLWNYYFKTFGTFNLMLVVLLQLSSVIGENFPRMHSRNLFLCMLTIYRNMAQIHHWALAAVN